jgi:hypothetical protein
MLKMERCSACSQVHERDNCPEAARRADEAERAWRREPVWDYEGAVLARQEDDGYSY